MSQTITGLFDRYEDAERAVRELEDAGVPHRDISIVGHDGRGEQDRGDGIDSHGHDRGEHAADDAGKGAGLGAAIGGAGGLLAGLGLLAIPGLGPVVAAGWLASTAVGALAGGAVGAAAGGLVGALTHAGVSEEDANVYAEGVRRGGTLVSAKVGDDKAQAAGAILRDYDRTVDPSSRRTAYEGEGWRGFDEAAPVYSPDMIAAERARYERV